MGCVKLSQGTNEVFALSDGNQTIYECRLCGKQCSEEEISEEHYPAKSVGNNDIVKVDNNGNVTALKLGETTIQAKSIDNNVLSNTVDIKVIEKSE